jgi:hypothetical protein
MNKATIAVSLFPFIFLTACGGGSTDNSTGIAGGVNGVDPVVAFTLKQSRSRKVDSRTVLYTSEGGYEGHIQYFTKHYQNGISDEEFQLMAEIQSLNITDVQREQSARFSCTDGSTLKVNISSDFSSGEVITTGTHNGMSIACQSNFTSSLPTNIFDRKSISALLKGWGVDYSTATSSNCTHQIEDMNGFSKDCTGAGLVNYTVTDSTGKTHEIATKMSFGN